MKKVLFVATVTSHIIAFHIPFLKMFKESGYEVHVASYGDENIEYCDVHYNLPFERFPIKPNNLKVYKKLKKIIDENEYEIIHCHTPVGGAVTRLAARNARKKGTRVIYTAHGFHFYKGAPLLNWLIYYPIEKLLARYTDTLITINQEDYERAKKFKAKQIKLVHGVGVDENKFNFEMSEQEKEEYRKELGLNKDDYVLICIGELNKNKNQIMQIEAMKELVKENSKIKLLIVGRGPLKELYIQKIKEYNLQENVFLLGYRTDIPKLLKISNCLLATSRREGLPVNVMEAMIAGLPVIATNCRGQRDLVSDENIVKHSDYNNLTEKIRYIIKQPNKTNGIKPNFTLKFIIDEMKNIYFK